MHPSNVLLNSSCSELRYTVAYSATANRECQWHLDTLNLIFQLALFQVLEEATVIGKVMSSVVIAMALAAASTALGILPASSAVYDAVGSFWMPLGAALQLLDSDMSRCDHTS